MEVNNVPPPHAAVRVRTGVRPYVSGKLSKLALRHTLLIFLSLIFFFPFVVMVSTSLKLPSEIFQLPPSLIPKHWDTSNYTSAFDEMPFWRYVFNTLFLCVVNVIGALFSCPLVAYSLAKIPWRGRNVLFLIILSTMMLPPQVTLIPVYVLWNDLGLVGTY